MRRLLAALALAVTSVAAGAGLATGQNQAPTLTGNQAYFGRTSNGMFVQFDVRGQVLTKNSFIDGVLWHTCTPGFHCTKKRWPTDVISLIDYREIPLQGDRISYHRVFKDANWWLEARRTGGGRLISGWVRQAAHPPGYTPVDSGKVLFTARLWASGAGVEWAGKTSDGKALTMSVGYQPSATYGSRVPFTVSDLARPLICRDADGATSTIQANVPHVEGAMTALYWRSDPGYRFPGRTAQDKPARGTATTPEGVTVKATMRVTKLAPNGSALAATGTLKLEGAATGEAGYACQPVTTTFTLKPR